MEVIEISGYTEIEKENIAEKFLVPKQIQENGLEWADITFQKSAILRLIRGYTMEAGVRSLEREIANILRKIAREAVKDGHIPPAPAEAPLAVETPAAQDAPGPVGDAVPADQPPPASGDPGEAPGGAPAPDPAPASSSPAAAAPAFRVVVSGRSVEKYLGKERFQENTFAQDMTPGLAYGLAWTELGGQLLAVEVAIVAGKGELTLTGSLGDVMKESAQAALTFLRAHHDTLGISPDFTKDRDIHVHVPEGAIPKDGPSAGITLTAALLSAVAGVPVTPGCAMTGEITLTGRLLPIGGVKEKVLAAHRYKMSKVLLPRRNEKDLEEIPAEVQRAMGFEFADSVLDALGILFPQRSFEASERDAGQGRPEVVVDALRRIPTFPAESPPQDQPAL
jgi:ATP-dependent Lon protease